ncbi:MAG: ATP-binding protein [Leptolyngbyaceae cyanobacterium]
MPSLDDAKTPVQEEIARLALALQQSKLENESLKQAHDEESRRREQVETELKASQQLLQIVMDTLPEKIFWKDRNLVYLGCNRNFAEDAGMSSPHELIGKTDYDMPWKQEESDFFRACDRRIMGSGTPEFGIIEPQLKSDGRQSWVETNKAPLHDASGNIIGILGTYQDITERIEADLALKELNEKLTQQKFELKCALQQLQQSQLQLVQQEKMSALGNLVSGIAHEINNPVGCIIGNLRPAAEYADDLLALLDQYQGELPEPPAQVAETIEAIDLEYLREDWPKLLQSMQEAANRIQEISHSLRIFSRADTESKTGFDLSTGIDSTILILQHRLKANDQRPAIQVAVDYSELPPVECFPGQLNQVFMNLLSNAIDALDEANQGKQFSEIKAHPNCINISTALSSDGQWAIIKIRDNGVGMTAEVQEKVFHNLFTTKAVGRGTGMGLAIAQQIVVEKHGGKISVESTLGEGTEFILQIPVQGN